MAPKSVPTPTKDQVAVTATVVEWYFTTYHGREQDMGMAATFASPEAVGFFAINPHAIEAGHADEIFKLLVAVAMFQRLRDAIVMQTLRGIASCDAQELTSLTALLDCVDKAACPHAKSNEALKRTCDLTKDVSGQARCTMAPEADCHLKRHSMLLRRYGHFGKVPSSAALMVRERGAPDLVALMQDVVTEAGNPGLASVRLEVAISGTWRIASKIAAMFLSLLTAPGMGFARVPWPSGIDWTRYVVVDRNVDLFLQTIGYGGSGTYDSRRDFVTALARQIDVSTFRPDLPPFHPRLVQQAMFCFMSKSNRRLAAVDCARDGRLCARCPQALVERCGVRPGQQVSIDLS